MTRDMRRQFINIIAMIAVLAFNAISETLPINNQTSADIANRFSNNLYFPANYAFSIWGIIYLFLLAFTVYQALPSQRENPQLRKIGYMFALTSLFNILWLTCFHYDAFGVSMVMMLCLLATLLRLYLVLDIGGKPVSRATKWLIHVPFSLYLGWITAATVANASYVILDIRANNMLFDSDTVWAIIMLVVTGALGVFMTYTRRDYAYGLVVIWAVWAINARHADTFPLIAGVSVGVCVAVAVTLAFTLFKTFRGQGEILAAKTAP